MFLSISSLRCPSHLVIPGRRPIGRTFSARSAHGAPMIRAMSDTHEPSSNAAALPPAPTASSREPSDPTPSPSAAASPTPSPRNPKNKNRRRGPPRPKTAALPIPVGAGSVDGLGVLELLESVRVGTVPVEVAADRLRGLSSGVIQVQDFARLDPNRADRTGVPEFVWGPGKTGLQISHILGSLAQAGRVAVATRVTLEQYEEAVKTNGKLHYDSVTRIMSLRPAANKGHRIAKLPGKVALVAAGTSDKTVAEECRQIAELLGCTVETYYDVGVAALHRLLGCVSDIRQCHVVICVAGMEAALPSVLAGLVDSPVIAVPTSIGYGTAYGGTTALLSALNACAPGVSVVNIDNGLGAAAAAAKMLRSAARLQQAGSAASAAQAQPQQQRQMSGRRPQQQQANGGAVAGQTNGIDGTAAAAPGVQKQRFQRGPQNRRPRVEANGASGVAVAAEDSAGSGCGGAPTAAAAAPVHKGHAHAKGHDNVSEKQVALGLF